MSQICPCCGHESQRDLLFTRRGFVWRGKEIPLSPTLVRIFKRLYHSMPEAVAYSGFISPSSNTLHVQITQLRYVLLCAGIPYSVVSIRGYGLVLVKRPDIEKERLLSA